LSYSDKIKDVIDGSDVAIFMKGTPAFVMCGNSGRALEALRRAGAPVTAIDVLPDPQIRQELTAISGWPTIPQVFVKGELVGGADIVEELEASGALEQTLRDKLGDAYADARAEQTVALA
jgi:monothiol glutaredoxin